MTDLHRHFIDHLTLPSAEGRGRLRRVDEVFDCWFESGSMPYAQLHYPFENRAFFEANFPADFVAEGACRVNTQKPPKAALSPVASCVGSHSACRACAESSSTMHISNTPAWPSHGLRGLKGLRFFTVHMPLQEF